MNISTDRLASLKVADAMAAQLVTVTANSTMAEAADVLCMHKITGAPVINELGKCVGVLSGTDFIHSKAEDAYADRFSPCLHRSEVDRSYAIGEVRNDLVRKHMHPAVKTIGVETPLLEAARNMCREHIHRLIVVDEDAKPVGILTTLDLVATLIGVAEE
jgi:predicted transcriptional regulator